MITKIPLYVNSNFYMEVYFMRNRDIKEAAQEAGVRLWRVAEKLKMADCNFSRKLRRELSSEEKDKILTIINKLANEDNPSC